MGLEQREQRGVCFPSSCSPAEILAAKVSAEDAFIYQYPVGPYGFPLGDQNLVDYKAPTYQELKVLLRIYLMNFFCYEVYINYSFIKNIKNTPLFIILFPKMFNFLHSRHSSRAENRKSPIRLRDRARG